MIFLQCSILFGLAYLGAPGATPTNFVFFGQEREAIYRVSFLEGSSIAGAQITYPWKLLEPTADHYDFSAIEKDLAFLQARSKRLFVQLQDVTFYDQYNHVPNYLRTEAFGGGANRQYSFANDKDDKPQPAGWVSRRWDPRVAARYHKLLAALGKTFDGKIAGINLPETAVDFGSTGKYYPEGFTPEGYVQAIKANMDAAKKAFPTSVVIQYANFMPGEWLPWDDKGYLKSIYAHGASIGVGLGGPDVKVWKKSQMNHSYALLPGLRGKVPTGIAVQDGNYAVTNPKTGRKVTVNEIYKFASDQIGVDYLFWCTEEPYFTRDVLPYLRHLSQK